MKENESKNEVIKNFIDQVRWLYEPEFGDFKRKVGLYIQRLEETHPELFKGTGKDVLSGMKTVVIYSPDGDIESTRQKVIQMAHELLGNSSGSLH